MFLEYFEFNKLNINSGASRSIMYFKNELCLQKKLKYFSLYKKWNAGKNDSGRIIFWTRGRKLNKQKLIKINYNFRYKNMCFIASFNFIPFKNKLLSLVYFSNGIIMYVPTTDQHILFDYIYYNKIKKMKRFFKETHWNILFFLKKLIFICFIELLPGRGAQYCLSSGTKSKLMYVDKIQRNAYIQLPSKVRKFFSYKSVVFLGQIALSQNKKYSNTKSGYWRSFGLKPIVRGVAMNPVDHPHGGRTKAIQHQRTPWGKTTKLK